MKEMTEIADMRESVEAIKAELGKGEVVVRNRQSGKTTAILEFIHENDPGYMVLVVCSPVIKDHTKRKYREFYPNDDQPVVVSIHQVSAMDVLGSNRCWVTDEVWPQAVIRKARGYAHAKYLGGVGTLQCMDMHSDYGDK
jgi:hypothetical protein